MGRFTGLAAAGILAGLSSTALAADLLPPPPPMPEPVPVAIGSGWYLRGDIGVSSQDVDKLENPAFDQAFPARVEMLQSGFDSAPIVGVGVGYRVNNFLRVDATAEYRSRASYKGLERYEEFGSGVRGTNEFSATKSEVVGLVNAYLDLGTWHGITPFVGAGVGLAHVMIDDFRDVNTPFATVAYSKDESKTNFAWAVYAGLGYEVTPNLSLELGYRYIHLGDGKTGDSYVAATGFNGVPDSWQFKRIDSHDFKIGMRWQLDAPVAVAEPMGYPLMRKY